MDVVYPYKSAPDDFELRHSLRSLANVPHDRVIIAGDKPLVTSAKVEHIPVQRIADRYESSTANILAAVSAGVSEEFIVMHDDIFVLAPWTFRHEHRCTIDEYVASLEPSGEYRARSARTGEILKALGIADPLFFGLHTPTVYRGDRLAQIVKEFEGEQYLLRTLYHNLFPLPSRRRSDVKVRFWPPETMPQDILSISDQCAGIRDFRAWIASRFPAKSEYEVGGRCLVLGYAPNVWREAARALDASDFDAVIASPEAAEHWSGEVLAVAVDDIHADRVARLCGFDEVVWCGRSERATA